MKILVEKNLEIITSIEERLSGRLASAKVRENVQAFLDKAKKVTAELGKVVPPEPYLTVGSGSYDNLADEFCANTKKILSAIAAEENKGIRAKLPDAFVASMQKLVAYLGDDDWLRHEQADSNPIKESLENLSLAKESRDDESVCSGQLPETEDCAPPSLSNKKEEESLPYPFEYHTLSGDTTLGLLLDPLFAKIFPRNTLIAGELHCRKKAGMSFSAVSAARLGSGQHGNELLYKILDDKILQKTFNDDRVIALFEKSISIGLLKVVIATALYRLVKKPAKFPVIGGVAYFMDIENEMLQSDNICTHLVRMVSSKTGKGIFFNAGKLELKGFTKRLINDSRLSRKLLEDNLPTPPQQVTRHWPPRFSAQIAVSAGISGDLLENYFLLDQVDEIRQFMEYMSRI